MLPDHENPSSNDASRGVSGTPPVIASVPPVSAPPPLASASIPKPSGMRRFLALVLTLFLGLFLTDGILSFADDALGLFSGIHILTVVRLPVGFFAGLFALLVYALMALTPLIPKRFFLPLTLCYPALQLLTIPFMIYFFGRLQQVVLGLTCLQVMLGLGVLYWIHGGFKLRGPLIPAGRLAGRGFTWLNLAGFVLMNAFVLVPVILVYLAFCGGIAVHHFSDGFMALHPGGLTVQARKYVRNDGKTIQLFPMSHIAESDFYQKISQTFPTNSLILMEGVSDTNNLLTNGISYKRMAAKFGLAEQHEKFAPARGKKVRADVDVSQFSPATIDLLNLVTLFHKRGMNATNMLMLMQYSPPLDAQEEMLNDILGKRNQHLVGEINSRLLESDHLVVPWGAAHIPGIAREIQKTGFRFEEATNYEVIRFHFLGNVAKAARP